MALTVDYLYQFMRTLIKKNQAGGLSATDFMDFFNDAQATYQDDLLGRFQRNSVTKEGINTGLIENEAIMSALAPFTKNQTGISVIGGVAAKPSDFRYALALRVNGQKVFKITHDQQWAVNKSVINPPSIANNNYYFVEYLSNYNLLPNAVTSLDLDYVAIPIDVVWNYTIDGQGRQIYTTTDSQDPLWGNNACREITKRALAALGVAFKDQDFERFGTKVQTQGE